MLKRQKARERPGPDYRIAAVVVGWRPSLLGRKSEKERKEERKKKESRRSFAFLVRDVSFRSDVGFGLLKQRLLLFEWKNFCSQNGTKSLRALSCVASSVLVATSYLASTSYHLRPTLPPGTCY